MSNVRDIKQSVNNNEILLGGKLRTICFDMNAFAELENHYDKPIQEVLGRLEQGRMSDIRLILWAGLIHEEVILDPVTQEPTGYNITPFQVGSWIKNPQMLTEVSKALAEAIGSSLPQEGENSLDSTPEPIQKPQTTPEGHKIARVVADVSEDHPKN